MWTCPKCGEQLEDQFDSCWQCAAAPKTAIKTAGAQSWRLIASTVLMSLAAPFVADGLHSLAIVLRGYALHQAMYFCYGYEPLVAIGLLGLRALISFGILRFFTNCEFRDRWIWIFLVIFWALVDIPFEPAAHK